MCLFSTFLLLISKQPFNVLFCLNLSKTNNFSGWSFCCLSRVTLYLTKLPKYSASMLKLFEATQVSKFVVTNVSGIYLRFSRACRNKVNSYYIPFLFFSDVVGILVKTWFRYWLAFFVSLLSVWSDRAIFESSWWQIFFQM